MAPRPTLRAPLSRGPLTVGALTILMHLADDGAPENPTERPLRSRYSVALVEAVGDSGDGGAA